MKTAAQIAEEALRDAERPEQERRAEEARLREMEDRRRVSRERASARKRLAKSPIPEWFPDVEWEFVERWRDLDVWKNGGITLGARGADVFFLRSKTWVNPQSGLGPSFGGKVMGYELLYPVKSAADVGRERRDYDAALVWPDSAAWSD